MKLTTSQRQIVADEAVALGVEAAALLAIVQVESNGVYGEMIRGRFEPIIRYEGHYFDKLCSPSIRDAARKAGVSAKEAGVVKNPKSQADRWKLLLKAAQFDASAAYQSCSYGVGQVMGSHWKALGFKSVDDLVAQARSGFKGQVNLMCRFIKAFGLDDELRSLDFSAFARGYNGKNYRKNKYDTNMLAAYHANGGSNEIDAVRSGTLRLGSKGAGVRDVQALLRLAGVYSGPIDGDFGVSTRDAVKQLQKVKKLKVDGVIGPKTQQVLSTYRDFAVEKPGQPKIVDIDGMKEAATIAVGVPATIQGAKKSVQDVITQLTPYEFLSDITHYLNIVLGVLTVSSIVVGVGYGIYKWRKSKKTYTGIIADPKFVQSELGTEQPLVLPPSA